ncbi:cytochrome d ubiquinol oxidase subunit II [Vibrio splendidus]|jgi:cytochrome d ubiquinol oxidase subunit II|uniref:Cytochrome d ubiquinol oxidase subunit II n=1 Tax=Vibrio splendidus TaxID=29497 RepID=A0AA43FV03_VIBSP|nr:MULTISPECIES: cytochrome d ubiquinol oxidase subunit II [Vibrio]MDH5920142.1 cytochrome d ubiquinol oxidase subunit II [Vibrio splendidus]PMH69834.1 cytochrome d ubiquinol oxidase subunit II [Vibrio splendidus]PMI21386.1 cytochrome d ubiquinol oxidase subunit II [Vibrio sp. 10N.286.46.E10]PMJ03018.1 cytochrome d ubiquinol oxidase subunit II [Vibrio sp. 10N.286.45.E10]PMJ30533.1 cytochrome d ubiquinol oxidase subunit II [Vibrio splendidus]
MFDYENLRLFTWAVIGVLLIGFIITDGFDMGVAALLPVLGKSEVDRRIMINSIAPHWDGNQVWLVTAGGAIFAIWPAIYAAAFSGFYLAMIIVLATLWLRPLGMDYRAKIDNPQWKKACDIALIVSGFIPPVIFGVGFGNLMIGVPFEFNELLMMSYQGGFWDLLTPFPLLCGLVSLAMVVTQGAAFLQMKTTGDLKQRAQKVIVCMALVTVGLFIVGGLYAYTLPGYLITSPVVTDGVSNPLLKHVMKFDDLLLHNYENYPVLWGIPALGIIGMLSCAVMTRLNRAGLAFASSSLSIASIITTAGVALFPMIMPSSLMPSHSLTLWDGTSSELTLSIISVVAVIVVPIILGYTIWCYYKMFGRLDSQYIHDNSSSLY